MGPDGDPLDVLILMDEPVFTGCVVCVRLVGVLLAQETKEDGQTQENDRLIAVASCSMDHKEVHSLKQIPPELLVEIEHFLRHTTRCKTRSSKPGVSMAASVR